MPPIIQTDKPWYRQKKAKWIFIGLGVFVSLVLIIGIGVFVTWYSSPQKSLVDAAQYAISHPATYHVDNGNGPLVVKIDHEKYDIAGTLDGTNVEAVITGNTLFVKSSDMSKLYDHYFASSVPASFSPLLKKIIPSLNNKWINLDFNNIPSRVAVNLGSVHCGLEAKNILGGNSDLAQQAIVPYLSNQFITIKTGEANTSATYNLSIDQQKLSGFNDAISKTKLYQSLASCQRPLGELQSSPAKDMKAVVTINKLSHRLDTLTLNGTNQATKITADYESSPTVTIPKTAVTVDQIMKSVLQTFTGSSPSI